MAPPGGKRGGGPNLAAIKNMMAARQAAEEAARLEAEAEQRRIEEEERKLQEADRLAEEAKAAKKEKEKQKREALKKQGKLLTRAEKEKQEKSQLRLQQLLAAQGVIVGANAAATNAEEGKKKKPIYENKKKKQQQETTTTEKKEEVVKEAENEDNWEEKFALSDDDADAQKKVSESESEDATDEDSEEEQVRTEMQGLSIQRQHNLRSPICCILGHVDTGKTKLLDKIRQTNVQEGEAGGITQQIGATFFPIQAIAEKTHHLTSLGDLEYKVPGLLVIDTPGHESFTNLRSRGSSLCNIAILVVDIMHGLEPQTLESIGLLRQRKTPFIVALNKVDRLYGWKSIPNVPFEECLKQQDRSVQNEFETRASKVIAAFSEQGLNAELFYQNDDIRCCVSLVPTSAITGDGIPDLLVLLITLTQKMMSEDLRYLSDQLECTVLEVKVIEGLGTTIDVILSNGLLREGDRIAVCGLNGPIVTTIRALLTPQSMRELRVKSQYVHNKIVKAALGVKICAPDLEKAVAGSSLFVISNNPKRGIPEVAAKQAVMQDLDDMLASVDKSGKGVFVQASTLGSLEALLVFLKDSKIPVAGIGIGPVHRKDIVRASVMVELAKEYACMLAFDVRVEKEAEESAQELEVKIFRADIIYHLFDQFTAYMNDLLEQKRRDMAPQAVFPCVLRIVPGCVFNKRSPLVIGVDVVEGVLRVGTPIMAVPKNAKGPQDHVTLGKVVSVESNHKALTSVRRGSPAVAIKLECAGYEAPRMFGRHFTESDELVSKISRESIDILKETFRNDMEKEDWAVVIKLKKYFNIQ